MDIIHLLVFLGIGGVAGWFAGAVMKAGGFGLLGNIIIGAVGGLRAACCSSCWLSLPTA